MDSIRLIELIAKMDSRNVKTFTCDFSIFTII